MEQVIIEAALNGSHPQGSRPHLPVTVAELAANALAALDAGAAIVHQHDQFSAFPEPGPAGMAAVGGAFCRAVLAERPDALLYPTANFPLGPLGLEDWAHHELLADDGLIRMAVWDPGAVSIARYAADGSLLGGRLYGYTPSEAEALAERCRERDLAPSIAVFEPGFLRTVLAYHAAGRLPAGAFVKLYFGGESTPFGLPPTPESLDVYLRLMGAAAEELPWAVAVISGDVVATGLAEAALQRGGHVRVGLEDYEGPRAPTNAELVTEVVALAAAAGRPAATPEQAARLLGIPSLPSARVGA